MRMHVQARSDMFTDGCTGTCTCTDTCKYANNGDCDDGGPGKSHSLCNLGTDCADCGSSVRASPDKGGTCTSLPTFVRPNATQYNSSTPTVLSTMLLTRPPTRLLKAFTGVTHLPTRTSFPALVPTDQANFSSLTPTLVPTGCQSCQNGDIKVTRLCIQPGSTVAEALRTLALCQRSIELLYATHSSLYPSPLIEF